MSINKIKPDVEVKRQETNLTDAQKKNIQTTKEGVVVNSLIKDPNQNINHLYDSMVISDNAKLPEKIYEKKDVKDKSLLPLSIIATGVMGTIAMISFLVKKSTKVTQNIKPEKKLDDYIRNVNINTEEIQGLYQMIHCPNKKTILAGTGVIAIGAMAFMGKMFIDGFKEVWVKKREADIQKNLQENLIAVETQSFSGKIQILRSMLADKARELNEYLCPNPQLPLACKNCDTKVNFKGEKEESKTPSSNTNNAKFLGFGLLTLSAIAGLGFLSIRNLSKGKGNLEEYIKMTKGKISQIISSSGSKAKGSEKTTLKNMLQSIDVSPEYTRSELSKLKWSKEEKNGFISDVVFSMEKSTTKPPAAIAGDGTPRPAFNSYVDGYKAFLYNYLLDTDNPQFKMLFWSITGLGALTYGGKVLGEAVKEVQVKKINAQTELELQQRLVATELRNFKAKKDAAIDPLCEEFYTQVNKGKSKQELQTMAENILFEVKNGPPFVYS